MALRPALQTLVRHAANGSNEPLLQIFCNAANVSSAQLKDRFSEMKLQYISLTLLVLLMLTLAMDAYYPIAAQQSRMTDAELGTSILSSLRSALILFAPAVLLFFTAVAVKRHKILNARLHMAVHMMMIAISITYSAFVMLLIYHL